MGPSLCRFAISSSRRDCCSEKEQLVPRTATFRRPIPHKCASDTFVSTLVHTHYCRRISGNGHQDPFTPVYCRYMTLPPPWHGASFMHYSSAPEAWVSSIHHSSAPVAWDIVDALLFRPRGMMNRWCTTLPPPFHEASSMHDSATPGEWSIADARLCYPRRMRYRRCTTFPSPGSIVDVHPFRPGAFLILLSTNWVLVTVK